MSISPVFEALQTMRQEALDLASQGLTYSRQSAGVKNIAFVVNGFNFYCDATHVREVSVCENLMVVPQTKSWMRGLINSKGVLYSVSDMSVLAGFSRQINAQKGHLLLMNDLAKQSALLVDRVIGFRYFNNDEAINDVNERLDQLDGLSAYVTQGYRADDQDWFELDVEKLLHSEQFLEIQ